uniref:Uncharacterized protein n=1 Tax=Polytomella parva TaxID=51329 RepID=A0A7S0YB22_9CHLO|mmetsp:Transcript_19477/g.35138  ORF Transcript_19477/g.35138 Transcript_19477/m.35138 type:complete len:191 (+) Transcript_19477:120-692(+)|eukprot:CAMPEP_0175078822 /NCGR_PEP_ID=MMETSP0052_2-20121109/24400_1 /TAXON_ID=51329 ORGANISM="Polytomella parva, Strain SAG 63-3" /NCGR_SAMPLE_ID=MMETSP0052_2 /ASSEMBLY_ACC=CAM_ASM_000194 /LENGTH=190 /DNA_ID=CAMNT_0016348923 /DNA_START=23 /DNA_END=595 /DNA_ORIENTATION=+
MSDTILKICVVGPPKVGKTLLCRSLADQPIFLGENAYQPTVAVRIQEFTKVIGATNERVKVHLWDCSGNTQYQSYWPVFSKDIDGVILVLDPQKPEQEKDLETFYRNFAEPNNLFTRQCLIFALQVQKGLGGWSGLQGGLKKLTNSFVSLSPSAPSVGLQEAMPQIDTLLAGCLQSKKEALESSYMGQDE